MMSLDLNQSRGQPPPGPVRFYLAELFSLCIKLLVAPQPSTDVPSLQLVAAQRILLAHALSGAPVRFGKRLEAARPSEEGDDLVWNILTRRRSTLGMPAASTTFPQRVGLTEGCEEMSWRALAARLTKKTDAPETITRAYRRMLSEPDGNAAGERDDDHLAVRFGLCICDCLRGSSDWADLESFDSSDKGKALANYKAPCLSKRQKRRRFEDLYWCNVHINAILGAERCRRRKDYNLDKVLDEYMAIAAHEISSRPARCPSAGMSVLNEIQ
ncbi:unnamed protein product [Cladocopium goreaui]|uniref:Carbon starvation induced protein CsiD n=1 Tax=Cladocopium goreaui TaxID=2562237 RepID=A0A9P1DMB6_9DINO|nr:unnamed protein product [Cladocopium goreaui]